MSKMHKCIQGLAALSLGTLCIPQAFAASSTAYFFGSIVEPACFVSAQYIDQTTPATPGFIHRVPLNVHCNAGQSVQISVQSNDTTIDNKTLNNGVRTNIMITSPGHSDTTSYRLSGKKGTVIPLTATLRKASSTDTTQTRGNVLISFNYH